MLSSRVIEDIASREAVDQRRQQVLIQCPHNLRIDYAVGVGLGNAAGLCMQSE
jgi:hypothetical protein